jgi:integrase
MRAKRDYAMLAMLFGCGFRRSELVGLQVDEIQMRQGHWAVVDLIGKGGHIRTVPIPEWVKAATRSVKNPSVSASRFVPLSVEPKYGLFDRFARYARISPANAWLEAT